MQRAAPGNTLPDSAWLADDRWVSYRKNPDAGGRVPGIHLQGLYLQNAPQGNSLSRAAGAAEEEDAGPSLPRPGHFGIYQSFPGEMGDFIKERIIFAVHFY